VNRSKIFVFERLGKSPTIDAERVVRAIEATRFPPASDRIDSRQELEPRLVQAADLIGQLGDPLYARKANALYYEFEEMGMNRQLGYMSPADLIDKYPGFFWNSVSKHIGLAMTYLNATTSGQQWIANLHNHVFCAEHSYHLMGPQKWRDPDPVALLPRLLGRIATIGVLREQVVPLQPILWPAIRDRLRPQPAERKF
jgi:hypothetical protein